MQTHDEFLLSTQRVKIQQGANKDLLNKKINKLKSTNILAFINNFFIATRKIKIEFNIWDRE